MSLALLQELVVVQAQELVHVSGLSLRKRMLLVPTWGHQ